VNVLCFGAYGNGNFGDRYQVAALQSLLPHEWLLHSTTRHKGDYPTPQQVEDCSAETCNRFDLLLIGGGGLFSLFSCLHAPLCSHQWAKQLRVPVAIVGVGAIPQVAHKSLRLIRQAVYVSGRDQESIATLQAIRPDVSWCPDPILATKPGWWPHGGPGGRKGVCWILRGTPQNPVRRSFYGWLSDNWHPDDLVLALCPRSDRGVRKLFGDRCVCTTDMETIVSHIVSAAAVASNRLHGCIAAVQLAVPCVALADDDRPHKAVSLMRSLGGMVVDLREPGECVRQAVLGEGAAYDLEPIRQQWDLQMSVLRSRLEASCSASSR
jgi:polysaccharide pyruvyl transferase WcaK-like protein